MFNQESDLSIPKDLEKKTQEIVAYITECLDILKAGEFETTKKQLDHIHRTIENLESKGIPVPDELRELKIKLMSDNFKYVEVSNNLSFIKSSFYELLNEIDKVINNRQRKRGRKPRQSSRGMDTTSKEVLREFIIEALEHFGGRAKAKQVKEWVANKNKDNWLPGDFETRKGGVLVWENNMQWARMQMVNRGELRNDSPYGVWELNEDS